MYARVTTTQVAPDQIDAIGQRFSTDALTALTQMPGYKGMYALVDRASGKLIYMSLWDTEAALDASTTAAAPMLSAALAGAGEPTVEKYEVAAQHVEDEGQRLAGALAQAARDLEGQVRRVANSEEVSRMSRQVEAQLRQFGDWAKRRGGPPDSTPPTPPPAGSA